MSEEDKGNKETKKPEFISRDRAKLKSYYQFEVTQSKFNYIASQMKKLRYKYFYRAFILGFVLQCIIVNTRIYENVIKKSTVRRLNAKVKEDKLLGEKKQRRERAKLVT